MFQKHQCLQKSVVHTQEGRIIIHQPFLQHSTSKIPHLSTSSAYAFFLAQLEAMWGKVPSPGHNTSSKELTKEICLWKKSYEINVTTPNTNMTMEKQPFEDVSPVKNWCFSIFMLVFRVVLSYHSPEKHNTEGASSSIILEPKSHGQETASQNAPATITARNDTAATSTGRNPLQDLLKVSGRLWSNW